MVACLSDYGTFPIWHHETDLYLLDLEIGLTEEMTTVTALQATAIIPGRRMAAGSFSAAAA